MSLQDQLKGQLRKAISHQRNEMRKTRRVAGWVMALFGFGYLLLYALSTGNFILWCLVILFGYLAYIIFYRRSRL